MEKDTNIAVEVVIDGKVEQVFDIITQVRFWPEWHVLTRAVTGVTQRPFLPGDHFTEFIRTSKGTVEVPWTVVDYVRFKKVSIQTSLNESIITYTFEQTPSGTLFKRVLDPGKKEAPKRDTTSDTETQSVNNLKALVERIIKNEAKGPIYP